MINVTVTVRTIPTWQVQSDMMLRISDLVLSDGTLWGSFLDARQKRVGSVYIAELHGFVVGWALKRPTPAWEPEGDHDFKIFVDPDFRRQGIGRSLFDEASLDSGRMVVYPHDTVSDYFLDSVTPEGSIFCDDWSVRGVDISDWISS